MERETLLRRIAEWLCDRDVGHPLRVGVDGVCGAGKSTFARELAQSIRARDRPAVHIDSDGFHHVRAIRHRRGSSSARGYYEDAYDFDSLRDLTLAPLGPGGSRRFARRVHDLVTDEVVVEFEVAAPGAVVIFDATFLQRGPLRDHWDEVIYLDVARQRAQERGVARDAEHLGSPETASAAYESRYMAACDIYLAEQDPRTRATIVIDNNDPTHPDLLTTLAPRDP